SSRPKLNEQSASRRAKRKGSRRIGEGDSAVRNLFRRVRSSAKFSRIISSDILFSLRAISLSTIARPGILCKPSEGHSQRPPASAKNHCKPHPKAIPSASEIGKALGEQTFSEILSYRWIPSPYLQGGPCEHAFFRE